MKFTNTYLSISYNLMNEHLSKFTLFSSFLCDGKKLLKAETLATLTQLSEHHSKRAMTSQWCQSTASSIYTGSEIHCHKNQTCDF